MPDLERVSAIEMPVQIVVGERTDPLRRGVWEQLAAEFKHAQMRVLAGQRHAAHQTAPALLANAVSDSIHLAAS